MSLSRTTSATNTAAEKDLWYASHQKNGIKATSSLTKNTWGGRQESGKGRGIISVLGDIELAGSPRTVMGDATRPREDIDNDDLPKADAPMLSNMQLAREAATD